VASGRGVSHDPWQAVDQDGNVLDILGKTPPRTAKAAKRFFRKLLKGQHYVPRVIITDKLKSYGAAKREFLPGVEHRQHPCIEQPGGKFAPIYKTAREENAEI
jgi:putative transposase